MNTQDQNTAKYALVTGGSRGIGKAICIQLAKDGFKVLINYISNAEEAKKTLDSVREAGSDGEIMQFNVADAESVKAAISGWQAAHPDEYISVLVNNAGVTRDNLLLWLTAEDWHKVVDTTLDGFFNATQAVLKPMISQRWGRIINIASLSGLKGMTGQTNYSAAKGGLIATTKALAQEIAKKKITVNAVAPGFVRTDMTSNLPEAELSKMVPMGRFGEPEEVAAVVSFLASERASYITGEVINVNGGLYS